MALHEKNFYNFHFEVITYCPTIARKLSTLDTYVLFHDRSVVYNTKGYKCLPAFGYFDWYFDSWGVRFNSLKARKYRSGIWSIEKRSKRLRRERERIDFLSRQNGGGSWPFRENVGSFETPAQDLALIRRGNVARKCRARTCTCNRVWARDDWWRQWKTQKGRRRRKRGEDGSQ